jgi:hypothetical protein
MLKWDHRIITSPVYPPHRVVTQHTRPSHRVELPGRFAPCLVATMTIARLQASNQTTCFAYASADLHSFYATALASTVCRILLCKRSSTFRLAQMTDRIPVPAGSGGLSHWNSPHSPIISVGGGKVKVWKKLRQKENELSTKQRQGHRGRQTKTNVCVTQRSQS